MVSNLARRQHYIFFVNRSKDIHSALSVKPSFYFKYPLLGGVVVVFLFSICCFQFAQQFVRFIALECFVLYQLGNIKVFKRTACALCVCFI